MKIILLTHPDFLSSQSMPRYANWLAQSMSARGHQVEQWKPEAIFFRLPLPKSLKKWVGYIDQYLLFPRGIKKRAKKQGKDTIFVFTDHALGPWVPHLSQFPHVIHCHDFLAQRSALDEIPENRTGKTGKVYQAYIRRGYRKGKNFISISAKTQTDLHRFLPSKPNVSEIIHNGLTRKFHPITDLVETRGKLGKSFRIDLSRGFILHVGGNQWYKNRRGVIEIYNAWRDMSSQRLPLTLIGPPPNLTLLSSYQQSKYQQDVFFLTDVNDSVVQDFYTTASVFIFPSLAEGFGWPIIEAMASGCPVITTNEAPMNEVAGNAAQYIDKKPYRNDKQKEWIKASASALEDLLSNTDKLQELREKGIQNSKRFDSEVTLNKIEQIYLRIINKQEPK